MEKWNIEYKTTKILSLEDQLAHLHFQIEWHCGPSLLIYLLTLVHLPVCSLFFIHIFFSSLLLYSISIFFFHLYSSGHQRMGNWEKVSLELWTIFLHLTPTLIHKCACNLQIRVNKISHTFLVCSNLIRTSISEKLLNLLK